MTATLRIHQKLCVVDLDYDRYVWTCEEDKILERILNISLGPILLLDIPGYDPSPFQTIADLAVKKYGKDAHIIDVLPTLRPNVPGRIY
ncbi:hypothetical protein [Candidatus Cyanaurora vandensis]|uniref:hypothetical protein n=1 Tax=Candidatus Cyanaurora vandensis TaxID=2714958 RepID=UPI00257DC197|nr:hypothetical protein [Candidatus Cyanaurora vandensis]